MVWFKDTDSKVRPRWVRARSRRVDPQRRFLPRRWKVPLLRAGEMRSLGILTIRFPTTSARDPSEHATVSVVDADKTGIATRDPRSAPTVAVCTTQVGSNRDLEADGIRPRGPAG